jgi:glycosyltransferase involved in cell wall biosynthesis
MAVGLPCVSTDHTPGGARLLIQNGENGLLAPMGDAGKLAECMCKFAEDKELAKKCVQEAKKVLERFDPRKIIDQWEEYIKKLTKRR